MRRIAAVGLVLAGVAIAAWLLWPRKPATDEELIREAIGQMADAAGRKDVSELLQHVSEAYRGEGGDQRELKRYLLGYLLRSDLVTALPTAFRLTEPIQGDHAKVSFVVLLARTPAKKVEDISQEQLAGSHHFEAEFVREGPRIWRVVNASRRDATASDWLH